MAIAGAHRTKARRELIALLLLVLAAAAGAHAPSALAAGQWSAPRRIVAEEVGLNSVSCVSRDFCAAVGNEEFTSYDGSSWTSAAGIDPQDLLSVSCPAAGACVLGDGSGRAADEAGGWSLEAVNEGAEIDSISCPTLSFCAAVDTSGGAEIGPRPGVDAWQGSDIDEVETLSSVSCVSASFCLAVDQDGNAFSFDGSGWSEQPGVDQSALESVSCASASYCLAVDQDGNALTYDGHSWGPPRAIDPNWLSGVSCPAEGSCVAVDLNGEALVEEDGRWSRPTRIDGENTLSAVSCAGREFCVAVDLSGNEVTYQGQGKGRPAPKPEKWPLPDPCRLPRGVLEGFAGRGLPASEEKLTREDPDSPGAQATCVFYSRSSGPHPTISIGYRRPPQPTAGVTTQPIPGWPGAELTDSDEPSYGNEAYFWIVTFKRDFDGHTLWGQTWWRGSSCTPGDPAGASAAEALYEAVGPGPKISVPAPHHVSNPCSG